MIQLQSNRLIFSFPELDDELRQLARPRLDSALRRLLDTSPYNALPQLREHWRYQTSREKERRAAEQRLTNLGREAIEQAFRREVGDLLPSTGSVACSMSIDFQRTLRIPDDGNVYSLPAGLSRFPLRHVDDFGDRIPERWKNRGGVAMPMYQSEALWLNFHGTWPFALQIAAGKINAATGEEWSEGLTREPQNYLNVPNQPWLDGFAVGKGIIRQFVAMPLGEGYSVEEQLTGASEWGGVQLQAYPLKAERWFDERHAGRIPRDLADLFDELDLLPETSAEHRVMSSPVCYAADSCVAEMGLGAGGQMRQEIYEDERDLDNWDRDHSSRCFLHLCNALQWRAITGENPSHPPLTADEYRRHRIPWFDHYRDDLEALEGSQKLAGVKTVSDIHQQKGSGNLPGNTSIETTEPLPIGPVKRPADVVREW